MLTNYFKIAWRNLVKHKAFSLINILGLTIGITVCMMIFLFITNEFSVDSFHKQKGQIYRVMRIYDSTKPGAPYLSGPYGPALQNDFSTELKQVVRVMPANVLISVGDRAFAEKRLYIADAGFFTLFSFPLIKGNPATVLNDPSGVVLTESAAQKYFGKEDPMGKVITLDKTRPLKVTGIAKDVPSNSHLNFDLVIPISIYSGEPWFNNWINNNQFTYVLLNEHVTKAQLEKRLPAFMDKYMAESMSRMGIRFKLTLTPLPDIYFEPSSAFDNVKHGDKKVVLIFLSIAALILLIACINFMNLSTIRAVERSKEVGLRKVMGALRNHLVWQFIGESVLLAAISCMLAIGLLQLVMPWYNQLLGYNLSVSWNTLPVYLFLLGVIIVVGFLAGMYPAFSLSAFTPIQALKGRLKLGKGGSFFRQVLVVVQFSISVLLIIGTTIIMSQMNYMKNKGLGYNKEQSVIIPVNNDDLYNHLSAFKNELQSKSNIAAVSFMSGEPGGFFDKHTFQAEGQHDEIWKSRTEFSDFEFVKTLGLKIIAGRDFSAQYATDSSEAVLINKTAAANLGYTPGQAIGKWIKNTIRDQKRRLIVGVVEDFNFLSLKESIDPLVIAPSDDIRVAVIRLKPGNLQSGLATIKEVYSKVSPVYPFEYSFLDQKFEVMYKNDIRQQTILTIFAGLAIFVACLGLFGLASFTASKRTKEIGVRKVLGSTVPNIVLLLSKDLLKPVLVATLIAIPIGYIAMNNWLQNFAYRIDMQWWVFALAGLVAGCIAVFTVSFQAIKAAVVSPVKSLRTE
jgi:putative ABC transport system permease protein